ncbi:MULTISPECIES: CopG family transcriptional regulator [Bacillus]|uniref:CopG family transcriptional regulator n=1 Tax=Bacillus TaxID=1386 RepID=UPI000BF13931|nr:MULTISPECIES: CopG family transcriptional regulator [Bacillus cereus group]PEI72285.1 CopG family transcriptional regulator [Bacillus toyonensis]PRT22464.1 CopG family transcriptional regulator [Bacillus wiedmannii]
MKIEELIKLLKGNTAKVVGKEIGICDKRLLRGLKNAGYEYSKKSDIGWHFAGQGEAPLKKDIREFIAVADDTRGENADNLLTKKEVSELRKMLSERNTTKSAVNTIMLQKEQILAQKSTNLIHSLHEHIRESELKEKVSRTINLNKETCSNLGTFEDKHRLNRDDIIEIALREFFKKYKG